MASVSIIKLDHKGMETFRYQGKTLQQKPNKIILEAIFGFEELHVEDVILRKGDRFIERFYTDRWYNIFEMHDRDDGYIKGWYCNIGYPAVIEDSRVSYRDLALDLLVYPDGRQMVLDADEFEVLDISEEIRQQALHGLAELQANFEDISKDLV